MTLIRKLGLALCSVLLFTICLSSNAQDATTSNLLSGASGSWSGTVPGSAGGYSGGYTAGFNPTTNTILFGYTQQTTTQSVAINSALQDTGIQVTGYNYSWKINNNTANYFGSLTGNVTLKGTAGNTLETYSYNYNAQNTTGDAEYFQLFSGTQNFTRNYLAGELSTISVSFTGKDSRFWAGYYGPRVRDPQLSLNYRVDPCANNPAYSPQCAGFNDLVTSINLVPYPNAVATGSNYVDNTYPIATVLSSSGSGLALHGFKYGFVYDLKDPYCSSSFLGIFCTGWTDSVARVSAGATNANGGLVFNNNHVFQGANTGPQEMNYQYLFPNSTNTNLMGNFHFSAQVEGNGSIYNMYSKMIVTPDPCMKNVMYSPTCTGFQEAIDKLNGTNKTDYATTGYTEPASVTAGTNTTDAITFTTSPSGSTVQAISPSTAPPPPPASTQTASSSSSSSTSTTSVSSSAGSAATSDRAVASPVNLSFAMNLISKNAEKEKAIAMSAVATAVEQAQAAGSQAQQEAVSVATKASEASMSTTTTTGSSSGTTSATSDSRSASAGGGLGLQSFAGMGAVQLQGGPQVQQQVTSTAITTMQQLQQMQLAPTVQSVAPVSQMTNQSFEIQANYSIVPSMQVASFAPTIAAPVFTETVQQSRGFQELSNSRREVEVEAPSTSTSFLIDRTNPLREIIEGQPIISGVSMEQQMSTVKKEVAVNEAAVGVDIAKIAMLPTGYNSYLTLVLKDSSFYAPRDIYPRQNTVDNVRALRQLSSDRVHQEMVNQQYKGR
jgi:hypothetical protein